MSDPIDILLVEDNPNDVELTLHALGKYHLSSRVFVVRDGAEAIDFLFSEGQYAGRVPENPKVVLLDLKLPKVSGTQVLYRIKSDPRTKSIPVVVLTSSNEERDIIESYRLGANSYILKPVDFEQFTSTVKQLELYWFLLNRSPGVETRP